MAASELTSKDLTTLLEFTKSLARSSGELIRRGSVAILQEGNVDEKKNSVDLVTEWDVKVEELVRNEISKNWPNFNL
jgi:myo-inositol-1(or 4)-monophosphatase